MPKLITDPTYVGSKAYVNYIKLLKKKYRNAMANHGYCKNCWWWNRTENTAGHCIMQSFSKASMVRTDENSYCPDYINREKHNKKYKKTLEKFCRDTNLLFFMYYELR